MIKQTLEQRTRDSVWSLIKEAGKRNGLNSDGLAKCMGIGTTTLSNRLEKPGSVSVDELLILLKLCGKRMIFVEVI